MQNTKNGKWLKIIALWFLLQGLGAFALYILALLSYWTISLAKLDHLAFFFNLTGSFIICIGLWKQSSFGWRSAIIYIPISWVLAIYDLHDDYSTGTGYIIAFFSFIDALILKYLYRTDVKHLLNISTSGLRKLNWLPYLFFALGVFFLTKDLFGDILALALTASLFLGFRTAHSTIKKLKREDT